MQKPNLTKICRSVKTATVKHSPEILTGVGIAGMVTTTVMAVRATPKAIQLLDEEKRRRHTEKLEPIDTIKTAWKFRSLQSMFSNIMKSGKTMSWIWTSSKRICGYTAVCD